MKIENDETKCNKALNYYTNKFKNIHSQIGNQADSAIAESLILEIKKYKQGIVAIRVTHLFDDDITKKCDNLLETAKYLTAYFSVFVDKSKLDDLLKDEYSDSLLDLF